jgi:hypothetical protein
MRAKTGLLLSALAIAAPLALLPRPAICDDTPKLSTPNQVTGDEITDAQRAAVDKGLAWLAGHQGPDGNFDDHAGITALAGLAFMEQGNLPGRGKYAANVQKCLDFVEGSCQESGLIAAANDSAPMYGHGFATVFLGELYGMCPDEDIKEKLQRAVRLIETTQNPQGGWRYQPVPYDADISVTICEIMALRSAKDSGIYTDPAVLHKAQDYILACQNPDGGFSYMEHEGGGSGFPRSAAGCCALYYSGMFSGDNLKNGLEYLRRTIGTGGTGAMEMEGHFFYGNYYACQAMMLAGGVYWKEYYPFIRDTLIARMGEGGDHWSGDYSDNYATAMALIILQMPNRYLPIFNGKGPGT